MRARTMHLIRKAALLSATGDHDDVRKVEIGDVQMNVGVPINPHLVPVNFGKAEEEDEETLHHLRWMLQKFQLGQDMFLIGGPGPRRRRLALHFCEVVGMEAEFLRITRDTTESDLKTRREISGGTASWHDQAPVRAAIHGRVLILDGIERAERNVLPTLNNLLENREMSLDDGRFLMRAARYDALKEEGADLAGSKMIRVHPRFCVIALGLPIPRYRGYPLDPPLRSRFQARAIDPFSVEGVVEGVELRGAGDAAVMQKRVNALLSFAQTVNLLRAEDADVTQLELNEASLSAIVKHMVKFQGSDVGNVVRRYLPYILARTTAGRRSGKSEEEGEMEPSKYRISKLLKEFKLSGEAAGTSTFGSYVVKGIAPCAEDKIIVSFANTQAGKNEVVEIETWGAPHCSPSSLSSSSSSSSSQPLLSEKKVFIETEATRRIFADVLQDLALGANPCVVGEKGTGKSALVLRVSNAMGYGDRRKIIHLYKDMSARDLLVRRSTNSKGDTSWELAPLLQAAQQGEMAILDGVHRIPPETLAVLEPLMQDRMISLPNGWQLLRSDRWEAIMEEQGLGEDEMHALGLLRVHPSFRVVAIAAPPSAEHDWLTTENASMFSFHRLEPLEEEVNEAVLREMFPDAAPELVHAAAAMAREFEKLKGEPVLEGSSISLSLRQLIRIVRRSSSYPQDFVPALERSMMMPFLPHSIQESVLRVISKVTSSVPLLSPQSSGGGGGGDFELQVGEERVKIGEVEMERGEPRTRSLVPDVVFHDIPQHRRILQDLMKDLISGEKHILLIGNQGWGRTRSWTGCWVYFGLREGRVIMIDEADKAPLEVVCILKGLLEDGSMILSDGRRLERNGGREREGNGGGAGGVVIPIHPNFRAIVLANRPGFPFLGNDFFHECGDIFSCHVIDNPDRDSELALLRHYGPDVDEVLLRKLVSIFSDLRRAIEEGKLSYPYSTRELVNLVVHLQRYPDDPVNSVLDNVLSFDKHDKLALLAVKRIIESHGIPVSAAGDKAVRLGEERPLPELRPLASWHAEGKAISSSVRAKSMDLHDFSVVRDQLSSSTTTAHERLTSFSERLWTWSLPSKAGSAFAVCSSSDGAVHVLCAPLVIYTFLPPDFVSFYRFDLSDFISLLSSLGSSMRMYPLPALGSVALLNLRGDLVLLLDHKTPKVMVCKIPKVKGPSSSSSSSEQEDQVSWSNFFEGKRGGDGKQSKTVCKVVPGGHSLLLYTVGSDSFLVLDFQERTSFSVQLPSGMRINELFPMQSSHWILRDDNGNVLYGDLSGLTGKERQGELLWMPIVEEAEGEKEVQTSGVAKSIRSAESCQRKVGEEEQNRLVLACDRSFATISDRPLSSVDFHTPSLGFIGVGGDHSMQLLSSPREDGSQPQQELGPLVILSNGNIVSYREDPKVGAHLEVVDAFRRRVKTIRLQPSSQEEEGKERRKEVVELISRMEGEGDLVTVGTVTEGRRSEQRVTIWKVSAEELQLELAQWRKLMGLGRRGEGEGGGKIRLTRNWDKKQQASGPKHGKAPDGKRHAGGNTWAGGTGGRDTAGLGGKGGPYRLDLDDGNEIMQISDEEKQNISEEAKEAARKMGQEELQKTLKQIGMSEFESAAYDKFLQPVEHDIRHMRLLLERVEARQKEREWLKLQPFGELDDSRLIDGVVGERLVYRRRGDKAPEPGSPQKLPKRFMFVLDVSASMYRFNSWDRRLERCCQMVTMLMEALHGFQHKISWSVVGHSGDGPDHRLIEFDEPPTDKAQRLRIVQTMWAHAQYCYTGDHTLAATQMAMEER
ncbi:hypothetical protein GUITHDRAFT_112197 [Guillardia theta CCMP2712]|uniref:ATPase dynein-related AAA domain-containing protein n=1 Tax=Guillardia theta (strain CCMP2712) TaxID=905079 RepID=L1IZU8_GUITC|nr:hypothetical protein GUITHDRAFT_112197 [Guillardia theta CCMP2712]EKX41778.1 hypothetical protein GUITHDRAFT_112197 [Guillardia theta CCMP2712]|eukprot:XP_005828758.1 hypothetical protein GUITHDRAFT_112197 [Guillardia theta CCMP2712]